MADKLHTYIQLWTPCTQANISCPHAPHALQSLLNCDCSLKVHPSSSPVQRECLQFVPPGITTCLSPAENNTAAGVQPAAEECQCRQLCQGRCQGLPWGSRVLSGSALCLTLHKLFYHPVGATRSMTQRLTSIQLMNYRKLMPCLKFTAVNL